MEEEGHRRVVLTEGKDDRQEMDGTARKWNGDRDGIVRRAGMKKGID